MYRINKTDQPRKPGLNSSRLLDQVRERLRYMHYSLRTEQNYVYWARWFIGWHGVHHPKDMGGKEVEAFHAPPPLSALLFLYKEVLDMELPWMPESCRPTPTKRIPVILTAEAVSQVLV